MKYGMAAEIAKTKRKEGAARQVKIAKNRKATWERGH
jgi:hypothetical protein